MLRLMVNPARATTGEAVDILMIILSNGIQERIAKADGRTHEGAEEQQCGCHHNACHRVHSNSPPSRSVTCPVPSRERRSKASYAGGLRSIGLTLHRRRAGRP